ncbi:MAG: divalent-cation tolerance protein CutA [Thaumarchaeota archaeon]|nr:divalent-cation tolerance protein CutA [Nitrososphaerota archaeon]MBI3641286.1 divalent-cation tolerance protein CutA [Nitrososphaerota archaeon]
MGAMIIISTYPNKKSVLKTANVVVKKQLAACVNFTEINSVYIWKGKMEKTEEFLAFFKTTSTSSPPLKTEIKKLHPYKVPEIAEIKINSINKSYFDWLVQSTRRNKSQK